MNNNVLVVILVIVIGVLSGVSLLFGIGNAVGVAVAPLASDMRELAVTQRSLLKMENRNGGGDVSQRLAAIEQKLADIDTKLGGGAAAAGAAQPQQPPQEDFNKVYDIPVGESPIFGKKDAPITIVEFSDLQCPFCARFHPAAEEAVKAYPDQVRLIIKNFPLSFHPNARPAAKLALAANLQGKYYDMAQVLLENGGDVSEAKIKDYAKKIGLNYNQLMDDYKNKDAQWEKWISTDMDLATQVDVRGTPTFFINGHKTMARDMAGYKAEIDKILADKK